MFASFMTNAWVAGTIVAVVAGVVGFFVVVRSSAFPAHAIPNGAFAGAAGAALVGAPVLVGLGLFAALAAIGIALLARRARRDVATALTLVVLLALGEAFLSRTTQYASQIFALLFGQILGVSSGDLLPLGALAAATVLVVAAVARPLLLSSALPEVGAAHGVGTARTEVVFLLVLAAATTVAVPIVGALLIFSLVIGPPAAARALTRSPGAAISLSVALALATIWLSIAASFWTDWPIGFFVGAVSAAVYGVARGAALWADRRTAPPAGPGHRPRGVMQVAGR